MHPQLSNRKHIIDEKISAKNHVSKESIMPCIMIIEHHGLRDTKVDSYQSIDVNYSIVLLFMPETSGTR
jgi:hypothetical protein